MLRQTRGKMLRLHRRWIFHKSIFSRLNDVPGDLAAQGDRVGRVVLGEAAEDGELGAQHVALGYGSDDFAGGQFNDRHGLSA